MPVIASLHFELRGGSSSRFFTGRGVGGVCGGGGGRRLLSMLKVGSSVACPQMSVDILGTS